MWRRIGQITLLLGLAACTHTPRPQPPLLDPEPVQPAPQPFQPTPEPTTSWRTLSEEVTPLPHHASWLRLRVRGSEGEVEISVVRFDSNSCTLRVIDQPQSWSFTDLLSDSMRSVKAIAGVNGGYFHPDFTPLGLMIANGKRQGQFTRSGLVSGMICVSDDEPALIWNSESPDTTNASDLLQAGPRLVDAGQPISGLNATKTAARSFIATDGDSGWLIGTVQSTTLHGLADLLISPGLISGLRIQRALNLDGGRSTAFYARTNDGREINQPGWSTVRNYVSVVPR
jgi:uncharacterized protein YigE (DUF2233 family)